jgi:hypothetical protein
MYVIVCLGYFYIAKIYEYYLDIDLNVSGPFVNGSGPCDSTSYESEEDVDTIFQFRNVGANTWRRVPTMDY